MFSVTDAVARVCEFLETQVDVWSPDHPLDSMENAASAASHKDLNSFLRHGISERLQRMIGGLSVIQVVCDSHRIIPLHLSDLGGFRMSPVSGVVHHRITYGSYLRDGARFVEVIAGRIACNSLSSQLRATTVGHVETQISRVTSPASRLINIAVIAGRK